MAPDRLRVLHVITRLPVGGAQENTLLTVGHLDRSRYEVTLASGPTVGPEGTLEHLIPPDITFIRIPELIRQAHPTKDAVALWKLYALMRRGRYAVVHTHTTKAGLLGRIAARLTGAPIVVHTPHGHAFHDYLGPSWSEALKVVERLMARWTDTIICLTEAERQDHLRFRIGPPEKFVVIHSGVDIDRFANVLVDGHAKRREVGLPVAGPLVGCIARLAPVKGVQHLLEAVPRIRTAVPGCTVVFVGDGPLGDELRRRVETLNLDGAVAFLGLRNDVNELLPLFDVVVLPSLNEGMGRAAVEAMAAGRPVVGSRVSGIQDVITHEVSGLLVPPSDADAIAGAVVRLLTDPNLATSLATNGRRNLVAYSIDKMIAGIDDLYRRLVDTPSFDRMNLRS